MKRLLAGTALALVLSSCSSAAAPGADNVVDQVEKAEDLEKQVEDRNSDLYGTP